MRFRSSYILAALLMLIPAFAQTQTQEQQQQEQKAARNSPKVETINLEAFQYGYSPDPIVVKKGDTVDIIATSRDVTHGFSIKEYGIDAIIKKGEKTKIKFVADKAGEFEIQCSVYCGPGHMQMEGKLIVQE